MFLKFLIIVLMLALLGSLGAGFYFLMVDQGDIRKRRLFNTLGVRLSIAVTLIVLLLYGVSTGKLKSQAPWERHGADAAAAQDLPRD